MCKQKSTTDTAVGEITEAQRLCLLHIFRNCGQALSGIIDLLQDPHSQIQTTDFTSLLPQVCQELIQVLHAAQAGTFCAISSAECAHVAPFVGCDGKPDLGKSANNQTNAGVALNILR